MSDRTLKALVLALVAVGGLWALVNLLGGRGEGRAEGSDAVAEVLAGLAPETVSAVRILGQDDTLILEREGSSWTVNGFRVDSAALASFWNQVEEAAVGDRVAINPANHARMGVTDDSATTVEFRSEGETRTLLVGERGPRFGTAFVRLPGQDPVFLLEGNLPTSLNRTLADWRNKRMATVDTARVQRIEMQREGNAYTLVRTDTVWSLEEGAEADHPTVRNLLGQLADLRASGFQEVSDTLPPTGISLTALDAQGDTLLVLELGQGEGERWARVRGDTVLYAFPSWRVDRTVPERSDLVAG